MTTREKFWDLGPDEPDELPELVSPEDRAHQDAAQARYVARTGSLAGYSVVDLDSYRDDDYEDGEAY